MLLRALWRMRPLVTVTEHMSSPESKVILYRQWMVLNFICMYVSGDWSRPVIIEKQDE